MKKFYLLALALFALSSLAFAQLTPIEQLGKKIYFDKIASPDRQSCADCHAGDVGWTGPIPSINKKGAVYPGAVPQRFGNRKPPSAGYATLSPIFNYDPGEDLFYGGNFWDGRATGWHLGSPAAEQALGPFLNPVEQNVPSKEAVLQQIATSQYAGLWEVVWGAPINFNDIEGEYDRVGLAVAAFEGSVEVNQFTSKYDYVLAGLATFTPLEAEGLALFEGQGQCAACHVPPEFTDNTFDNLGIPKNPDNPFYNMDEVFINGIPINPLGANWIDYGLGDFLRGLVTDESWRTLPNVPADMLALTPAALTEKAEASDGKHRVPTLRNVDKRKGNGFTKAYGHNGYFKSLEEITHFYNTRDVEPWPAPEVPDNINSDELGNLELTADQEKAIVAFMKTLSDGYKLPKPKNAPLASTTLAVVGANPFNPSTRFSYTLPEAGTVRMDVFNIIGQKVATLVNGPQAAGEYQVDFSANNLPSGIYLVRLESGREVLTAKVTLIK